MSSIMSQEAFKELYLSYYTRVYNTAFSLLRQKQAAEDITQLVFLRLWEEKEKIQPNNLEGYLITMAKNAIFNQFRSRAVHRRYRRFLRETFELGAGNVEEICMRRQQQQALENAVAQLPSRQQQAWRLSRETGLTYRQIASEMGISRDTVKELLQKALHTIRSHLENFLMCFLW